MSLTIDLAEQEHARIADAAIEVDPPQGLAFVAEGVITVSEELLQNNQGMSFNPTEVVFDSEEGQPVAVDLTGTASLQLEEVDVGVETPEKEDLASGLGTANPSTVDAEAGMPQIDTGVVAFTVKGTIQDIPTDVLESLSDRSLSLAAVTFSAGETLKSDGGPTDDTLTTITILGLEITIYRGGVIAIGTDGELTDLSLS